MWPEILKTAENYGRMKIMHEPEQSSRIGRKVEKEGGYLY
jgi:hypothetical protein